MTKTFFIINITEKMPRKTDLILKAVCHELGLKANCITSKQLRVYSKYSTEYKSIADIFFKIKKNACVTIISPNTSTHEFETRWNLENVYSAIHTIKKKEDDIKKEQDIHFIGVIYNNTFFKIETLEEVYRYNKENKKGKTEILKSMSSVTSYLTIHLHKKAQDYTNMYSFINQKILNHIVLKRNIYI